MNVEGLAIPIEDSPFGPRPQATDDRELNWLQWVVNAALTGDLPDFIECVERGDWCSDDAVLARPALPSDDLETAGANWRARTGQELGDDVYRVSVSWRGGEGFYLPRRALIEIVRELQRRRAVAPKPPGPWLFTMHPVYHEPHPDEEATLRLLETHARELDAMFATRGDVEHEATVAVRRRFLLAELSSYGLLTGQNGYHRARWLERWQLPTLLGYQRAGIAIGEYWSSAPRLRRIGPPPEAPSVLGASVSVDWFRFPKPTPAEWDADDWLAFAERALIDASPNGQDGELFVHQSGVRVTIVWRCDDGVHPSVVAASVIARP